MFCTLRQDTALLLTVLVLGCTTTPTGNPGLLEFLSGQRVIKDETVARLGRPHETFESGLVLTYRIGENASGFYVVPPPKGWEDLEICAPRTGVNYNLVLVFDADGLLVRKNLVTIRAAEPSKHEKN